MSLNCNLETSFKCEVNEHWSQLNTIIKTKLRGAQTSCREGNLNQHHLHVSLPERRHKMCKFILLVTTSHCLLLQSLSCHTLLDGRHIKMCHQQGLHVTACCPALGLPTFCSRNSLAFPLDGGILLFCSILLSLAKHLVLQGMTQTL